MEKEELYRYVDHTALKAFTTTEKQIMMTPIYFVRKELTFPTFFILFSIGYTS